MLVIVRRGHPKQYGIREFVMTNEAADVIAKYDQLPVEAQQHVLLELLRRTPLSQDQLADHELTQLADSLFQQLDAEEAHADDASSR